MTRDFPVSTLKAIDIPYQFAEKLLKFVIASKAKQSDQNKIKENQIAASLRLLAMTS